MSVTHDFGIDVILFSYQKYISQLWTNFLTFQPRL